MPKKLSMTQQWMRDHPDDEPPPAERRDAIEWREKRFGWKVNAARERYEQDRKRYDEALQATMASRRPQPRITRRRNHD
jgi:hypothetical protein